MPMTADLLFGGGEVIDVGGGHVGRFDVAVLAGRIAAVAPSLPREDVREVVDVSGRVVTPGLVDLHTHVHPQASFWGIDPDPTAWVSGVTTWVDAGSAGAYTLDSLRASARGYRVRVPVLLNISATGLVNDYGECRDLALCDVDQAVAAITANRDLVVGVKVRMDRAVVGQHGLEPLRRALEVGHECDVPVMVHLGAGPPAAGEVLALLRPGDIVTHCATGRATGLLAGAAVAAEVRDAYTAGVLFDIGHGAGGFAFDVLEAQLAAGLVPHTVSTDLHARSVLGPVFDLPTTMMKMLAVGLTLPTVVAAVTARPANAVKIGTGIGTLTPGTPADLAIFAIEEGEFEVFDAHRQKRYAPLRLRNEATYVDGRPLPPRLPADPKPWIPLTPAQRAALSRRCQAVRELLTTPLVGPDGLADQFPRMKEADA
jgi:dihydroorotase